MLVIGAGSAFLMNSPTPSTMPINSASTFQQIIKLFNDERHKLELYVASKEQAFNARELALELRVNKTIDEMAKATSELNKEKGKTIKVEQDVDQLTMQIFNLTTNNNNLLAKMRGLESKNIDLENKLMEINRSQTLIFKGLETKDLGMETLLNELATNQTLKYLALETSIKTVTANNSALKKSFETKHSTIEAQLNELKLNGTLQWQRLEGIENNITWQICKAECNVFNRKQTQVLSTRKFSFIILNLKKVATLFN